MRRQLDPTTSQNATSRLFLRFFLLYLLSVPVWLLSAARMHTVSMAFAGTAQLLFLLFSLLGALLTVTKPYLLFLTVCKAFYDATLLRYLTGRVQSGAVGILPFNAFFFLIAFSAILFSVSAAGAELFAFLHTERNFKLLLSPAFGRYLVRAIVLTAVALTLYFLWPQIYTALGA